MDDRRLFKVGAMGALAAMLFCVTPVLVLLLAAVGISEAAGWLDYILLPGLALCVGIMVYSGIRRRRREENGTPQSPR